MFLYDSVIMLAVILVITFFARVVKIKNKTALVSVILVSIFLGGIALYVVQCFFGVRFYSQKIDLNQLRQLRVTDIRKGYDQKHFNDFSKISESSGRYENAVCKTYRVKEKGVNSKIDVTVYFFKDKKEADNYFILSQKLYENKTYLPSDPLHSVKKENTYPRYIVSYVKSYYRDYGDIVYLPSKISYLSDVTYQDESMVIVMNEESNKAETGKNAVLKDLISRFR
ncbi:MAG TPA: hypothetical protein VHR42_01240 [Clostridia bacterium]|nr:hypothetical protein [Clostridia bacterium]